MSRKIVKAIADLLEEADKDILKYPNQEDLAEAILSEVEQLQAAALEADEKKQKLVVVGQIQFPGEENPHVVSLGPFGGRAVGAASKAGEGLAWDSKSGTGKGRFMVVPAFSSARAAWDHYRKNRPEIEDELVVMNQIQRTISDGPVCECGLRNSTYCHRHQKELS